VLPDGNYNLQGFAPTNGFFHRFIGRFIGAQEGSVFMAFMADNFFLGQKVSGKCQWISMDGAKMECSHDEEDVDLYLKFFKAQYDEVNPGVWGVYEDIMRNSCVNARTLLGTKQFPTPWLSSGYSHTADINCLKMAKIVGFIKAMINHSRGEKLPEALYALLESAYGEVNQKGDFKSVLEGGNFVDMADKQMFAPVFAMQGVTMTVEQRVEDVAWTLLKEGYVDLDFLGFGVCENPVIKKIGIPMFFPTLSRHRLLKSISFAKSDRSYKDNNPEQQRLKQMAHNAKYVSLYLFGAAHIPDLANLLHASFYRSTARYEFNEEVFMTAIGEYLQEFGIKEAVSLSDMFSLESVI